MKILEFVKTYWRAILFVLYLVVCLTLLIGGIGWTDYAETKFWQAAWIVLSILGFFGFVSGVWWLSKQKNLKW